MAIPGKAPEIKIRFAFAKMKSAGAPQGSPSLGFREMKSAGFGDCMPLRLC